MNDSRFWQLKISSNVFDFQSWLRDGETEFFYWSPIQATEDYHGNFIRLHGLYKHIKNGDKIALTIHHDEYGVIGLGEVDSSFLSEKIDEYDKYYIVDTNHSFKIPIIKIWINKIFFDIPITWRHLKEKKLLNKISIKKRGILFTASEYSPGKIDKDG
ncbi:hypothetical protein JXL21_07905, partial [Candidatus Bathyarchaeota archaeon]|nr:hypothetical protein [Candidatus Bathyarchaeota archaeon]